MRIEDGGFRMKRMITAGIALLCLASPALAWEGKTVACYNKVLVPAKYSVTKVKIKEGKQQYEHRNGRIELVDYPPLYKEQRKLVEPEYYVMRPIPCH